MPEAAPGHSCSATTPSALRYSRQRPTSPATASSRYRARTPWPELGVLSPVVVQGVGDVGQRHAYRRHTIQSIARRPWQRCAQG